MIMAANMLVLLVLSLIPGHDAHRDPHGLASIVNDGEYRQLLLSGRFDEYGAALDSALSRQLAFELGQRKRGVTAAKVRDAVLAGQRSDLQTLFAGIKAAISVATLATELHALGPAKAMRLAISWVEDGLIRRSGLKPAEFSSFYRITSRPNRARLDDGDLRALESDARDATGVMNSGFSRLLGELTESIF